MRTLIFSDTHLAERFESDKFSFLYSAISRADKVIIAGDFWDVWHTSFDRFLRSEWSHLFPLLKKKRTVYLWGNHDPASAMDERVEFFCDLMDREYVVRVQGKQWLVTHGDCFTSSNEQIFHVSPGNEFARSILRGWERAESFVARRFGKKGLLVFDRKYDVQVREGVRLTGVPYITGHTHVFRTDPSANHLCSGFIRHGLGQYIEIVNDSFRFHSQRYDKA